MIKILHSEPFYPLGKPLPRPEETKDVVDAVQIRPGIWRKPDGTMETRIPTPPQLPVPPLHPPKQQHVGDGRSTTFEIVPPPLPVVPNALGDGWIDCSPAMPNLKAGSYELLKVATEYRWTPRGASLLETVGPSYRNPSYQYRLIP